MVRYAPRDAPFIGKGRWSWPQALLEDKKLVKKIIARGISLQLDVAQWKADNINRERTNPQLMWETFKSDIRKTAKEHAKNSTHKIKVKLRALDEDRKSTAAARDFKNNEARQTEEAFLANEIAHLERASAKTRKEIFRARRNNHGERLGSIWSAMSKSKKPRDPIYRLKIPNSNPPQYERNTKRMAKLARDYHENLQSDGIPHTENRDAHSQKTDQILQEIPNAQKLNEPELSPMNWQIKRNQVEEAIHLAKCTSAPGMDGCPYELWKKLKDEHNEALNKNTPSFDITGTLMEVFNDIQKNGVDPRTEFSLGWMCPIYKKKDPTDISNYRPITLLNTDYKLLTKVLALQLTDSVQFLIHPDQVGFIPRRSIFNHIRLANAIINYAELTEEDGAIIALDQEKAYDKIRHDYLWETINTFGLPKPFTNMVKALYKDACTVVVINGVMSEPYLVIRGVRQGNPLSCPLFDLAIKPLACKIRNDPRITGVQIPGQAERITIKLFADDANLYLNKDDRFDHIQNTLDDWCGASGAKFNIEKMEIIPIGTTAHRQRVIAQRKINEQDLSPLTNRIHIAKDGESIRMLGAWIGNQANNDTPWETIIDKINGNLVKWKRLHPTLNGRKQIIQAVVGGHTQFLTNAQGMPTHIESAIKKIVSGFMWDNNSSPRIANDTLCRPIHQGGLNLLDITTRNEAIDIIWLKKYLNFSSSRPTWAAITDIIVQELAPKRGLDEIEYTPFLQC